MFSNQVVCRAYAIGPWQSLIMSTRFLFVMAHRSNFCKFESFAATILIIFSITRISKSLVTLDVVLHDTDLSPIQGAPKTSGFHSETTPEGIYPNAHTNVFYIGLKGKRHHTTKRWMKPSLLFRMHIRGRDSRCL